MAISNGSAQYGISAIGSLDSTQTNGTAALGNTGSVSAAAANVWYSIKAFIANSGDTFTLNVATGSTSGSTSFTTGTAQVETATVIGTITTAGNASTTVTAAGMTGSPKTISTAVLVDDTASDVAGKIRTDLAADADVSALFTVSGTGANIILTRKPTGTYVLSAATTVSAYAANDATLNIATDNGTCAGLTAAPTSTNTTAGVVTDGCQIVDGDGNDYQGNALATIATLQALELRTADDEVDFNFSTGGTDSIKLKAGSYCTLANATDLTAQLDTALTAIPTTGPAVVTITALGTTA